MGRIPEPAEQILRMLKGGQAKAVAIAVYGNRNYDDALIELYDILFQQDFRICAAGAFVAQHSIIGAIAEGRPNKDDIAQIKQFADEVKAKLSAQNTDDKLHIPGNRPYIQLPGTKRPIAVSSSCTECGLCADKCPVDAIPNNNPHETDLDQCIGCMRCIHICPQGARQFPKPVYDKLNAYMGQYAQPKKNEWYL